MPCDVIVRAIIPLGSGRGAAWLARLLGVQEVPSSNLGGPTKFWLYANNGARQLRFTRRLVLAMLMVDIVMTV